MELSTSKERLIELIDKYKWIIKMNTQVYGEEFIDKEKFNEMFEEEPEEWYKKNRIRIRRDKEEE
jgi:hypothetical protein